ncbi:MAG: ribonuclease H-like domain-containing protein [Candidatus Paceibacterota bacterium]|jgi:DEAD/DEAH box helicase domain-containing protein
MKDIIVFDIETKNTFADVGGQENIAKLEMSVTGLYSYNEDTYHCFDENELDKIEAYLKGAYLIIGFYSKKFDVPVLEKYFKSNIAKIAHFDILEEIEKRMGRRVGLGVLAEANLGEGKSAHGLQAIEFYRDGEIQKLKDYCLQDVKITKRIYDQIKEKKFLYIPQRNTTEMKKISFEDYVEIIPPPAQLL